VGQIATQHVIQTAQDWWSSVGNFFPFVLDREALLVGKLNITFLWSYPHVHGWITWINKWVAGSTKRNKALHLISLLEQPTFILWLLDHVEHCSAPFQKSPQDTTSLAVKVHKQPQQLNQSNCSVLQVRV
jgi:hypothetical protein